MSAEPAVVDGTWIITIRTPMGPQVGHLDFATQGVDLTGTFRIRGETHELRDGTVEDGRLAWNVKLRKPIPMTARFSASIDGDAMTGVAKIGPMGDAPFEGKPETVA